MGPCLKLAGIGTQKLKTHLHRDELEVRSGDGLHEGTIGGHPDLYGAGSEGQEVWGHIDQVTGLSIPDYLH